ncbi:MAG: triphosphoribosyl-dephospho-CoA synthase [Gemmataceae bacterium]
MPDPLPVGLSAQLACVLEATARKPGNVHRTADFADCTFLDFLLSAAAIGPAMNQAVGRPVGETVLDAIRATRRVTTVNTNLGIVLLLAPLAAVPDGGSVRDVLRATTVADARAVYDAIRLATPGGLGRAGEQDVADEPTVTLLDAMRLAADRDGVARQYATDFADVVAATLATDRPLEDAIVRLHLELLAARPDTLIARKCGREVAAEASARAAGVLSGKPLAEFDDWLRADGHRRNPGTTADLVTAALFVALRRGIIQLPLPAPFSTAMFR